MATIKGFTVSGIQWVDKSAKRRIKTKINPDVHITKTTSGSDKKIAYSVRFSDAVIRCLGDSIKQMRVGYDEERERVYFAPIHDDRTAYTVSIKNRAAYTKIHAVNAPFFSGFVGDFDLHQDTENGFYFIEKSEEQIAAEKQEEQQMMIDMEGVFNG